MQTTPPSLAATITTTTIITLKAWLTTWCPGLDDMDYHVSELRACIRSKGRMPTHAEFDSWTMGGCQ